MSERTITTEQGEVSYETVICQSCGDEVAKEGAKRCLVGNWKNEKHLNYSDKHRYNFDGRPDEGWLCDFCHENPAAYPHRNDTTSDEEQSNGRLWHLAKFIKG